MTPNERITFVSAQLFHLCRNKSGGDYCEPLESSSYDQNASRHTQEKENINLQGTLSFVLRCQSVPGEFSGFTLLNALMGICVPHDIIIIILGYMIYFESTGTFDLTTKKKGEDRMEKNIEQKYFRGLEI